jgi:large subunit ribosomal protein L15
MQLWMLSKNLKFVQQFLHKIMKKPIDLSKLNAIVDKSKRRIGRGHGSGRVKTSGRGTKGQNARGHMPIAFEGGQLPLIKRLPLLRGKGKNGQVTFKATVVDISRLEALPDKSDVTLETLIKLHIIKDDVKKVKIVGKSKIDKVLNVKISCSKSAAESIKKAGGTYSY